MYMNDIVGFLEHLFWVTAVGCGMRKGILLGTVPISVLFNLLASNKVNKVMWAIQLHICCACANG